MTDYDRSIDNRREALRFAFDIVNHGSHQWPQDDVSPIPSLEDRVIQLADKFHEYMTRDSRPAVSGVLKIGDLGRHPDIAAVPLPKYRDLTSAVSLDMIPRNGPGSAEGSVQTVPESEWAARLAGIRKMAESPLSIYNKNHRGRPENKLPSELFGAANEGKWDGPIVQGVDLVEVANPDEPIDIGNILPEPKTKPGDVDLGPGKLVTGRNVVDSEGDAVATLPKPVEKGVPFVKVPKKEVKTSAKKEEDDAAAVYHFTREPPQSGTMDDETRRFTGFDNGVKAKFDHDASNVTPSFDNATMKVEGLHNDPYKPNRARNSR